MLSPHRCTYACKNCALPRIEILCESVDVGIGLQRRWDVEDDEYVPPPGCGHVVSGRDLEALVAGSMRTEQRFVGQCNVITDIKEATFVGQEDAVVACGSDQGRVFLFDAETGELLRVLWADREVANCVQCHPTLPVLATSGMDDVVRLPLTATPCHTGRELA